jgi:hypothetical protein
MLSAAARHASGSPWLAIACHMIVNPALIYSNIEPRWGADALQATERLMTLIQALVAVWVAGRLATAPRGAVGALNLAFA